MPYAVLISAFNVTFRAVNRRPRNAHWVGPGPDVFGLTDATSNVGLVGAWAEDAAMTGSMQEIPIILGSPPFSISSFSR
jgi:hypothetical protein